MQPSLVRSVFALLLPLGTIGAQGTAPPAVRIDLPVKAVTLFSSGVGYFEHAGTVRGDGSAELRFKTVQINDILKSLILQDQDGGKVSAITYPSQDPISKTLRSFQVDITANPTMGSLLTQLRGAKITVQWQAEKFSGTILGVENRQKKGDRDELIETPVVNIVAGGMIRSIELPAISAFSLDDPQLQDELSRALEALSQARDQDKKSVAISFIGSGQRRVRLGYVVETPVWKTSYRLMMDEKGARLQGWAIVENQTESDWNNVSLSLVSGRPISFIMDLYQPLYSRRPTVVPELFAGLRPQSYQAGITGDQVRNMPADRAVQIQEIVVTAPRNSLVPRDGVATKQGLSVGATGFEEASIAAGGSNAVYGNAQTGTMNVSTRGGSSVESIATTAQLGALFRYAIPNVTLARQKSAMLPIVTDTVGIERLSIYNASVLPRNPLNGVRLKNTTGKHFLQGPVTVLERGAYAGDARIDDVPPGQERLLSYGIDLDLLIDNTKNTTSGSIVTGRVSKGVLIVERRLVTAQDYLVDNKGTKDKTIVIEHPVRAGWKFVDTQKPLEVTSTLYRFERNAVAGKVTVITIKEESVRQESVALLPAGVVQLASYNRYGEIPGSVRDVLSKAIRMKQSIVDLEAQSASRTAQIADIAREQERIRENMKTVEAKSQYYERLLSKLNEQESSIEKLQKERDDLTAKLDSERKALEEYLSGLTMG